MRKKKKKKTKNGAKKKFIFVTSIKHGVETSVPSKGVKFNPGR